MRDDDTVRQVAAVDERTKILVKSMKSVHDKLDNLQCGKQAEQIRTLQRESKEYREKNLDKRIWAIEKLFWPSTVAGITSFTGFVFFVLKEVV